MKGTWCSARVKKTGKISFFFFQGNVKGAFHRLKNYTGHRRPVCIRRKFPGTRRQWQNHGTRDFGMAFILAAFRKTRMQDDPFLVSCLPGGSCQGCSRSRWIPGENFIRHFLPVPLRRHGIAGTGGLDSGLFFCNSSSSWHNHVRSIKDTRHRPVAGMTETVAETVRIARSFFMR